MTFGHVTHQHRKRPSYCGGTSLAPPKCPNIGWCRLTDEFVSGSWTWFVSLLTAVINVSIMLPFFADSQIDTNLMGCKSSSEVRPVPLRPVPFPHRGPRSAPAGERFEDTGYVNPHEGASSEFAPRVRTPRSTRSSAGGRRVIDASQLSPHESDDDLLLICADCGVEIEWCQDGDRCSVSGKRHS
jgi:hypothetical protein